MSKKMSTKAVVITETDVSYRKFRNCMAPLMRLPCPEKGPSTPVQTPPKLDPAKFFVMMTKVRMCRHHHKLPVIAGNDGVVLAGLRVNDATQTPKEAMALKDRVVTIQSTLNNFATGHVLTEQRLLGRWFFTFDQMTFGLVIDNTLAAGVRYYLRHVVSGSCYCVTEKITEQVLRKRVKACRGMKNDNLFDVALDNTPKLTNCTVTESSAHPTKFKTTITIGQRPIAKGIEGVKLKPATGDAKRDALSFLRAVTADLQRASKQADAKNQVLKLVSVPLEVVKGDCGTTAGVRIRACDLEKFIGKYIMTPEGPVELTKRNLVRFGKGTHLLRSPITCLKGGHRACTICAGKDH